MSGEIDPGELIARLVKQNAPELAIDPATYAAQVQAWANMNPAEREHTTASLAFGAIIGLVDVQRRLVEIGAQVEALVQLATARGDTDVALLEAVRALEVKVPSTKRPKTVEAVGEAP